MEIVFATNNYNKLKEVRSLLSDININILSLKDIGCKEELPETHETLEENAREKARFVANKYQINCFSEDTGLEINSLNGEPGVYSARYAGLKCVAEDNIKKVLKKMKGIIDRSAQFRTVISLIINGKEIQFEGVVKGNIFYEKIGKEGFGYDPIFQPVDYDVSFAQMDMETKSRISHRGKAVRKLIDYLLN